MEIISKETQDRLDQVELQLRGMQGELLQHSTATMEYMQRIKLLEETDKRREEDIRELKEATRGMWKQFDTLINRFDNLEAKFFAWMQQMQKDNTALIQAAQQDGSKERQSSQKEWMRFLQIVLAGTMFLIVAYIFSTNFKG